MIDAVTPRERLRCRNPDCWSWKLAMVLIAAACILGLMLT
jgi:hypothetical protein